jgi:hypothetical protein
MAIEIATGANRTKASAKESILVIVLGPSRSGSVFDEEMRLRLSADARGEEVFYAFGQTRRANEKGADLGWSAPSVLNRRRRVWGDQATIKEA